MSPTLQEAKERVRIPDLWREFGYEGEPRKSCFCPFHKNTKTPAFSVFNEGKAWKCHAGCGEGDAIDFQAKAKGLTNEEACKEFLRRAGSNHNIVRPAERPKRERAKLELPPLVPYTEKIGQCIAESRGLGIIAVEFGSIWLGTVVFGRVCDEKCWILTDAARRCAEARRIDRQTFPAIGTLAERKSHTLPGSSKNWPVGILPPAFEEPWLRRHVHKIIMVEGGPDYLAACQLIAAQDMNVLPVAMLGASQSIADDALPYFKERHTTVVAHADEAGHAAGKRWASQIQEAGGRVRLVTLTKGDLCDAVAGGATNKELGLL